LVQILAPSRVLVQFFYHSAIKTTPFQALYGRPPPSIPNYVSGTASEPNIDTTLQERTQILHQLKTNLVLSQQHMAKTANVGRRHHVFTDGDWVLLRRQAYRQTSIIGFPHHKLTKKFYGPYTITKRVGEVAYELALPPDSKIHPVFHISLLKPYHGPKPSLPHHPHSQKRSPPLSHSSNTNHKITLSETSLPPINFTSLH